MDEQLRQAARGGDLPKLRRVLQQPGGVNVNAADYHGWTALHCAVHKGHLAIVQAILQVDGVNVNASLNDGETPLQSAISSRGFADASNARQQVVQALLEAGADPNAFDGYGHSLLSLCTIYRCPLSAVEALLDGGADPAARNSNLDTPLHTACFWGDSILSSC